MKWCFLFVLVKVDVFKVILLQILPILSSRDEDVAPFERQKIKVYIFERANLSSHEVSPY